MAIQIKRVGKKIWVWTDTVGRWLLYDPDDPTGSDLSKIAAEMYVREAQKTPTEPTTPTTQPGGGGEWPFAEDPSLRRPYQRSAGGGTPTGFLNPPGSADFWMDQPAEAQWLNRLMKSGQIGSSGVARNPYQSWMVDQSTRANWLNMMQNLATHGTSEGMTPFSSAQIPWGQGRQLFSQLAGMGPETAAGETMAGLTPKQTMGMAYTGSRGFLPELMRQQMGGNYESLHNRYLATTGGAEDAPGYAPWLSQYYGF